MLVRSQQRLKSHDDQHSDSDAQVAPTRCPAHSHPTCTPPTPSLNDLIRALEHSPPHDLTSICADTYVTDSKIADNAHVSAVEKSLPYKELQTNIDDSNAIADRTHSMTPKASGENTIKSQISIAKKRPTISDDDYSRMKKKRKAKSCSIKTSPKAASTEKNGIVTLEDCMSTIGSAVSEKRIDEKKAERLQECLRSGNWSEIAFSLLCEQIPLKRKGKGYSCRICQVPKKGHTCMYCHICSTPEKKFKKDDEHVCINCPTCFEVGKKAKKLVQIKCDGHVCPHGPLAVNPTTKNVPV